MYQCVAYMTCRGRDRMVCNQCLSPLTLWVWFSIRARCTTLCDKVCQWLATGLWYSPGPSVYSTNKSDRQDLTEILLKVALNTIKQINNRWLVLLFKFVIFQLIKGHNSETINGIWTQTVTVYWGKKKHCLK